MRIGRIAITNFQSFKDLHFDYSDLGLALVSGETGAGKSTLMDAASWIIFGTTGKDDMADSVRAWDEAGPTVGVARIATPTGQIAVVRVRGKPANDLHFAEVVNGIVGVPVRGKDLPDTQRLLEKRLGVTAELFLAGSYLTQFSKADTFFIAKAKDRRDTLEQIADQEFAISLGEKTSEARKVAKKEKEGLDLHAAKGEGRLEALQAQIKINEVDSANWIANQVIKVTDLSRKLETFDQDKARTVSAIKVKSGEWQIAQNDRIKAAQLDIDCDWNIVEDDQQYEVALKECAANIATLIATKCRECGGAVAGEELEAARVEQEALREARRQNSAIRDKRARLEQIIKDLNKAADPHLSGLQQAQNQTNPYGEQLVAAKAEINPYVDRLQKARDALYETSKRCYEVGELLKENAALIARLGWLYDKSFELRGLLMARVVSQVEAQTNSYLEKYFDAALRVKFTLADSDKLEVEILNQGYTASFKALSGGERCMLKLCFSLSLMKAAQNKAGVQFGTIMLDEPMAGLDEALKNRAFGLFQELAQTYNSVMVIDHSESFKQMFSVSIWSPSKAETAVSKRSPEQNALRRVQRSTPEARARARAYNQSPARREYMRNYMKVWAHTPCRRLGGALPNKRA